VVFCLAKSEEKNPVELLFESTRGIWRSLPQNAVMGAILNTFDALKIQNKDGVKPVLITRKKTDFGEELLFHLPPGVSAKDIEAKLDYFQEQANCLIDLKSYGPTLRMEVYTSELQKKIPFVWDCEPYLKDMILPIPVGVSARGLIVEDLADMPHMLIAGHPGSGKSNALHCFACSLLGLGDCLVAIIDFKKLEFSYLRDKALLVTDAPMCYELLVRMNEEMDKRLDILADAGCVKIQEYNRKGGDMPYIALIIDELAEMSNKASQELLNRLVRLSRACGICVICATQRPSSTIFNKFGDTKANFPASLCFKVRDGVNSRIVLDNERAAQLPANIPGRAIWQWDTEVIVQAMNLPISRARKLVSSLDGDGRGMPFELRAKRLNP
jgi:S-DNA-T family DNA segregation ATPase FtsK/SpoIIIE